MVPLDLDKQIPRRADQRQMETWQRLGVYTAGLALEDAGIAGNLDILSHTHAVVAADGGARDEEVDDSILTGLEGAPDAAAYLNQRLSNDLRPTLFLAQLPNLLAGNISIVHKLTGSSRTFMGEEIAGVSAAEVAWRRIRAGQGDIFLVGGASQADRKDTVLNCALGGILWAGDPVSVWARQEKGGGSIFGSAGGFIVLEAREHAEARGAKPYARLADIRTDQTRRRPGDVAAAASRQFDAMLPEGSPPAAVLSGATGVAMQTQEERAVLDRLIAAGRVDTVRATSTLHRHGCRRHLPGHGRAGRAGAQARGVSSRRPTRAGSSVRPRASRSASPSPRWASGAAKAWASSRRSTEEARDG